MSDKTEKNNIQDYVLNKAKEIGDELTFYLMNGVPLKGKVISFDNFTLVIESEGKKSLLYKHAISTIIIPSSISVE
ncbi:MAG: RNA chaperone Hfq [Leptospiraceae bacterium]|nr:RNA chaperone Hfq [Leptospiraceae bacterium]MDW7975959.1 RNA chaperone Hfq [Leptospiraceae bacterium]